MARPGAGPLSGKGASSGAGGNALEKVALIAIAGAAGALVRYGLAVVVTRYWPSPFPAGIFAVNMAGCLLFGVIWVLAEERGWVGLNWRLAALTGFMGAFTTFSTFAFDTVQLARGSNWGLAAWNVVLTNAGGVLAVLAGFRLGRVV